MDQDIWDSEVENFDLVTPTTVVLFIKVCLVREGEVGGALESVVDFDMVDLEMGGKAAVQMVSFSIALGVGCTIANIRIGQ